MTTHFYTASSLDGFIATPQDSLEWLFAQHFDQEGPMSYESFIPGIGALVMGRSTYQWLLKHQDTWEYSQPTWVFTHRQLPGIEGADIRFISDDVGSSFADIQASAQGKDIWVREAVTSPANSPMRVIWMNSGSSSHPSLWAAAKPYSPGTCNSNCWTHPETMISSARITACSANSAHRHRQPPH